MGYTFAVGHFLVIAFFKVFLTTYSLQISGSGNFVVPNECFTLTCSYDVFQNDRTTVYTVQDKSNNGLASYTIRYLNSTGQCYYRNPSYVQCTVDVCSCDVDGLASHLCYNHISTVTGNLSFNCASGSSSSIQIPVAVGPSSVSFNTDSQSITTNETYTLGPIQCIAVCVPNCTYHWSGPGIKENVSILHITDIMRDRSGKYICTATNMFGNATAELEVVVQFGPDIINLNPSNETYTVLESTSVGPIYCNSSCYPVCGYKWKGPGIVVEEDHLQFSKIKRTNSGKFVCTARNSVNRLQKEISIVVEYGPSHVRVNSSSPKIIVNESDHVGPINCTADCVPACVYRWSGPWIIGNISILQIENISRNQNGTYSCLAINAIDRKSVDIHIEVQFGPSAVSIEPSNQTYTIKENSSLDEIACTSTCFPRCSFYWTGPALSSKPEKLHLTNISRIQKGKYTCIAHNVVGVAQIEVTITVIFAAKVIFVNTSHDIQAIRENTNVSFFCGAEGLPIPEMSWYYVNTNGTRKLLNTANATHTQYDLSFVECTDSGTYICEANNKLFPLSNKSRDLNVTCAPRVQNSCSSRRLIAVKSNTTLSVAVCFLSNPIPNVNWTLIISNNSSISIGNDKNKVYQNSSILYTAVIETKLINKTQEQYNVYAYNSFGESQVQKFTVVVEDRPFPPSDVYVTCKETNTLYWTSNFDGGSEQVFRIIYFENNITAKEIPENISDIEAGHLMYTVLKDLKPSKHYTFQVIAMNKFNRTESNSVYCLTAASPDVDGTNIAAMIGGITGTALVTLLIAIGIAVFWIRRRNYKHKSDYESKGRKKLTSMNKEDEEEDGLKDNILYESAGHDFDHSQGPVGAIVTKKKETAKSNGDNNIQETALYSEVMKKSKNDQNADVNTNVVKCKELKEKNKGRKMESREDVYENMSGEVGNVESNCPEKQRRNKDGLVYADLIFNPFTSGPRFIHGIDDRTIYADVDTTQKIDPLPDSDDEGSNEDKPTED